MADQVEEKCDSADSDEQLKEMNLKQEKEQKLNQSNLDCSSLANEINTRLYFMKYYNVLLFVLNMALFFQRIQNSIISLTTAQAIIFYIPGFIFWLYASIQFKCAFRFQQQTLKFPQRSISNIQYGILASFILDMIGVSIQYWYLPPLEPVIFLIDTTNFEIITQLLNLSSFQRLKCLMNRIKMTEYQIV